MKTLLHRLPRVTLALAWWGAALALPAAADGVQGWLFFSPDLPGESTDAGHEEWLDCHAAAAGGVAPLDGSTILLARSTDKATPKLFEACATGRHFPAVKLHLSKLEAGKPRLFWDLEFKEVLISSFKSSGESGQEGGEGEELALTHRGIRMTYYRIDDSAAPPVTTVIPYSGDSDGDGMPDDFETQHALELYSDDGGLDADGDGLTNREEFQVGTDPRSGSSFFRATAETGPPGSNQLTLTWNSVPGAAYDVRFSANLVDPFEPVIRITAEGTTTRHTVATGLRGFYQIEKVEP